MAQLQIYCVVWVPALESLLYGSKLPTLVNLHRIAKEMETFRPASYPIVYGSTLPDTDVVKRGFSGYGNHVILPSHSAEERDWSMFPRTGFSVVDNAWFRQPYIDNLKKPNMGEIRCFFAGGTFCHAVHTMPEASQDGVPSSAISMTHVMGVVPLDRIRYVAALSQWMVWRADLAEASSQ